MDESISLYIILKLLPNGIFLPIRFEKETTLLTCTPVTFASYKDINFFIKVCSANSKNSLSNSLDSLVSPLAAIKFSIIVKIISNSSNIGKSSSILSIISSTFFVSVKSNSDFIFGYSFSILLNCSFNSSIFSLSFFVFLFLLPILSSSFFTVSACAISQLSLSTKFILTFSYSNKYSALLSSIFSKPNFIAKDPSFITGKSTFT